MPSQIKAQRQFHLTMPPFSLNGQVNAGMPFTVGNVATSNGLANAWTILSRQWTNKLPRDSQRIGATNSPGLPIVWMPNQADGGNWRNHFIRHPQCVVFNKGNANINGKAFVLGSIGGVMKSAGIGACFFTDLGGPAQFFLQFDRNSCTDLGDPSRLFGYGVPFGTYAQCIETDPRTGSPISYDLSIVPGDLTRWALGNALYLTVLDQQPPAPNAVPTILGSGIYVQCVSDGSFSRPTPTALNNDIGTTNAIIAAASAAGARVKWVNYVVVGDDGFSSNAQNLVNYVTSKVNLIPGGAVQARYYVTRDISSGNRTGNIQNQINGDMITDIRSFFGI